MMNGAGIETFGVGQDNGYRGIELTKAPHDPILPSYLVVAFDAHGFEQLDGDFDLALAVHAFIAVTNGDLTLHFRPGHHSFRVARPDPIQWLAGENVQKPRLSVHRRGRTLGEFDDFVDDGLGYRVRFVAADASA